MSRFFFNFQQGPTYSIDTEGCEFESAEEAYLGAFAAAQDMWRELLIKRQDPLACAFEVMDDRGNTLFALPFSEVLDACRGHTGESPSRSAHASEVQALESRRQARVAFAEVSDTLEQARSTLRETVGLLQQVNRILQD